MTISPEERAALRDAAESEEDHLCMTPELLLALLDALEAAEQQVAEMRAMFDGNTYLVNYANMQAQRDIAIADRDAARQQVAELTREMTVDQRLANAQGEWIMQRG